jgi:hypothetical protein
LRKIVDRNGCAIIVPKDGDSDEAKNFMEVVKNSFKFYAFDGIIYPEGDITNITVVPSPTGDMANIQVKDHNNPASIEKSIILQNADLESAKAFFLRNNFSSWEAFKTNLLPSFNGPDSACFVGTNFHGGNLGAMFTIPKENIIKVA